MTDPTDPTGLAQPAASTTDDVDRAWFRAQLDPILDAPATDTTGWPALAAAASAGETADLTPVAAPSPGHQRHRLLVAAAVIVVVVAIGAVTIANRDDGSTPVTTAPAEPTGWYVPVGLPEGWKVESVVAYPGRATCERHGVQWTDPAGQRSLGLSFDACGQAPAADDASDLAFGGAPPDMVPTDRFVEAELGPETIGTSVRMSNDDGSDLDINRMLGWNEDDGAWTIVAVGLTFDQLVDAATAVVRDTSDPDIAVPGLEVVDRWSVPARSRSAEVQVGLLDPDGLRTSYLLELPGDGSRPAGDSVLIPTAVRDQSNPVFKYQPRTFWAGRYGGYWPGADLTFYRWTEELTDSAHMITDEGMEQLIGTLRPATAREWQEFLATADTVSPVLREATSMLDLAGRDFERPEELDPDIVTTTTPPTTTTPTTTPDVSGEPVVSKPAAVLPPDEPSTSFSDLSGLEVRLEVATREIRSGDTLDASLLWANTTEAEIVVNECTSLLTTGGLVPAADPDGQLPLKVITDCYDTPQITVPPGETVRTEIPDGLVAREPSGDTIGRNPYAATLEPGPHLAVVRIPGSASALRIVLPIEITAPLCSTTDEDIQRYGDLTEAEARAAAEEAGDAIRIAAIDREPKALTRDLDCNRINLDLSGGRVWDALRY